MGSLLCRTIGLLPLALQVPEHRCLKEIICPLSCGQPVVSCNVGLEHVRLLHLVQVEHLDVLCPEAVFASGERHLKVRLKGAHLSVAQPFDGRDISDVEHCARLFVGAMVPVDHQQELPTFGDDQLLLLGCDEGVDLSGELAGDNVHDGIAALDIEGWKWTGVCQHLYCNILVIHCGSPFKNLLRSERNMLA